MLRTFLAAGLTLAACGGSSGDLCTRAYNAAVKSDNEINQCEGGAVTPPNQAEIAQCQQELASCTSSDQTIINNLVNCEDGLPAVQCQWLTDAAAGKLDPDYVSWAAQALACYPTQQISVACQTATGLSFPADGGF